MPHTPNIPDIPGDLVSPNAVDLLKQYVAKLCQIHNTKFPGSQPVSFAQRDLDRLENEDYWVCEKSDGVRVLFFIQTLNDDTQLVYLIDRHNSYRLVNGFFFPHHENPQRGLRSTILDGELVIDTDPRTGQGTLHFLAFDCLVIDGSNIMSRTLDKRYGRLQEWLIKPYKKMMQDHPHMAQRMPFGIILKAMNLSYGIEKVFNEDIPKLQHGNDGLIFTPLQSPYVVGTDPKILKWKPPSENTIDFKLVLRFPPLPKSPSEPDFCAKPIFALHVFTGGNDIYEPFDELYMDDEEWEQLKASGEQVDDRIVEVFWETSHERWRMMRFRDDKPNGNYKTVVENIIQSIIDGVEKEDLLARTNAIRTAWKVRQAQSAGQPGRGNGPPPPAQHHPPTHHPHQNGAPSSRPQADLRYGPLQESLYSRVGGPEVFLGFHR